MGAFGSGFGSFSGYGSGAASGASGLSSLFGAGGGAGMGALLSPQFMVPAAMMLGAGASSKKAPGLSNSLMPLAFLSALML